MRLESARARSRTVRIGITGPIGCGKSTVAGWLAERPGVIVIDADLVARDVLDPGEPALTAVVERFGGEIVRGDGSLDRSALGRIVFADRAALQDLEAIVHPAVRFRIRAAMTAATAAGARAVVVEAIKLVEGGLAAECDEVWLVTCAPTVQRSRLIERGSPSADAEQRIAAQAGIVDRVGPLATRVIDTSGDVATTRSQVDVAFDSVLRASRSPASR